MLLNRRRAVLAATLLVSIAVVLSARLTARAQPEPPGVLFLPLVGANVDADGIPRPPTPMPTATATATAASTQTPQPTATVPSPTPTEIPATATVTPVPSLITGRFTVNGQPVALGIGANPDEPQIELHKRERGQWQKVANTTILDDGRFVFENPGPLGFGEAYQVWWEVDPNLFMVEWLTRWMSREISEFGAGDEMDLGTFEVADTVVLTQPENFWWHTLPLTFSWRGRSVSGESYRFTLARRCGHNSNDINREDVYQGPPEQRRFSFTLTGLPAGYRYNTDYCWYVTIEGADGGTGWSVYYRHIEFRE